MSRYNATAPNNSLDRSAEQRTLYSQDLSLAKLIAAPGQLNRSTARMTEIETKRECLSRVVGEPLTAVMFVMDYLKLQFEESVLTILTPILVRTGDNSYEHGDMPWRDSLCDRITHTVSDLTLAEDHLQISFDDDSNFQIALRDEALAGNEALIFEYREAPGPWQMLVMHIV